MPTSDRLNISSRSRSSASSSVCCDFRREMSVSTATTSFSPGAARRGAPTASTRPPPSAAATPGTASSVSKLCPACSDGQRLREAAEQLADGRAGGGAGLQAEHELEAPVAAHQHRAAQVGDAGGRAVEDGGQLAQQLLALALRAFLLGHVERDHRCAGRNRASPGSTRVSSQRRPSSACFTA